MKRLLIGAIGIAALTGLGFVAPAHAVSHSVYINEGRPSAVPGDCVRGGGSASGDTSASGTINQHRYPCANGNYAQRTGPDDGSFSGNVTCVAVWGNESVISGTITSATGDIVGSTAFQEVSIDNSSPSSPSNPDTDVWFYGTFAPSCAFPGPVSVQPLTAGDIRIV